MSMAELRLESKVLQKRLDVMRATQDVSAKEAILHNTLDQLLAELRPSNLTSMFPLQQNNIYAPITLNWMMLMYAYCTHGPLQTAHDQPVLDALRGGIEVQTKQLSPDEIVALEEDLEATDTYATWTDVGIWKRVFGGSAMIINTDEDPERPLDVNKIRRGQRVRLYDASRWELGSPMREAEYYSFYGQRLHCSRVVTQVGKRAPWLKRQQLQGWGMSEMERMIEPFNIYMRAMNAIYELLNEAKVDVYRLKGLNKQLAGSPRDRRMTRERIDAANRMKGFLNAVILDFDDEYVQKQVAFSGLAEMANEARIALCSAIKFPMTKLFGTSPTGMSGDDESGTENYNSMVESEVRVGMKPLIKYTLKLKCAALFGKPIDCQFDYKPLRVLKATEEEENKTSRHNRYKEMYQSGVMTAPEWAQAAHKDGIVKAALAAEHGEDFPIGPMSALTAEGVEGDEDGGEEQA